jgi:mycothiol system anti-sigma-R factor
MYLDGELAAEEGTVIQLHLDECISCAHHYGFERDFKELVHRKCAEGRAPDALVQRIRLNIRQVLGE